MGASYDRRISVAWVTGFTDFARYTVVGTQVVESDERAWFRKRLLPPSRMRITNGQADELTSGSLALMRESILVRLMGGQGLCWKRLSHWGERERLCRSCNTIRLDYDSVSQPEQRRTIVGSTCCPLDTTLRTMATGSQYDCLSGTFSRPGAWLSGTSSFSLVPSAHWLAQTAALGPLAQAMVEVDFDYLPTVQAQYSYPWGLLDWGPGNSNFYVKAGAAEPGAPATVDPKHMTIGNTPNTPSTGRFDFEAQNGEPIAYRVYNGASATATVTTTLEFVDGRPASLAPQDVAASTLGVIPVWAGGVRRVTITSSNGSALKFKNFVVLGSAASGRANEKNTRNLSSAATPQRTASRLMLRVGTCGRSGSG